jgi:hypothetical protein
MNTFPRIKNVGVIKATEMDDHIEMERAYYETTLRMISGMLTLNGMQQLAYWIPKIMEEDAKACPPHPPSVPVDKNQFKRIEIEKNYLSSTLTMISSMSDPSSIRDLALVCPRIVANDSAAYARLSRPQPSIENGGGGGVLKRKADPEPLEEEGGKKQKLSVEESVTDEEEENAQKFLVHLADPTGRNKTYFEGFEYVETRSKNNYYRCLSCKIHMPQSKIKGHQNC